MFEVKKSVIKEVEESYLCKSYPDKMPYIYGLLSMLLQWTQNLAIILILADEAGGNC